MTKDKLLMGRDKAYPSDYTPKISHNLDHLTATMCQVEAAIGYEFDVNSGWRPPAINGSTPGAAGHSSHMDGNAVDVRDPNGDVARWILNNLDLMQKLGLYFEDFRWTLGWCHFQQVPPGSGKRIYIPYADIQKHPMTDPGIWDGKYDHKYDKAV